ncbi:MAG: phosphate ABC transporter substrate-binding protein [Erysipelotrichaceae bacterium]
MKKILTCLVMLTLLAGCGSSATSETNLTVGGSTSIQPLMEDFSAGFEAKELGTLDIQGGGSGVGIKGVNSNAFQVGMVSRELTTEESASLDVHEIAIDGICVILNKENKLEDLTTEQIKDIFTGKITNWKEVGGADNPIAVISREDGSGTRAAFEEIVGYKAKELVANAEIQKATNALIQSVDSNPNAIGFISLGSLKDSVKAANVNGVVANVENITNKTYKLQRPYNLVSKKGNEAEIKPLLDYIKSEDGKKIIVDKKYIPVE